MEYRVWTILLWVAAQVVHAVSAMYTGGMAGEEEKSDMDLFQSAHTRRLGLLSVLVALAWFMLNVCFQV